MNTSLIAASLLVAIAAAGCDRGVIAVPVSVPTPAPTPGPPGPAGATGATGSEGMQGQTGQTGNTGKTGDGTTIIVVPAPEPPASDPAK